MLVNDAAAHRHGSGEMIDTTAGPNYAWNDAALVMAAHAMGLGEMAPGGGFYDGGIDRPRLVPAALSPEEFPRLCESAPL
jgi:hypothetical protein